MRIATTLALLLTTMLGACASRTADVRAIWVTRWDYRTEADVERIVGNCADAGFNTVLFQVRGNGTAFYASTLEPWAEELGGAHPGFDPLSVACAAAARRGVSLQAWVNVMPGWTGPSKPRDPNQLYNRRPEWFWRDAQGRPQPLVHRVGDKTRGWYVSVNPCWPEVRAYLVEVFREIVRGYDIDALHLDYIRFPNEPVLPGETIPDYPRDPNTLALYRAETGLAPDDDPKAWDRWRTEQVNRLVADIRAMVREEKPHVALTAAVGTDREKSLAHHRDARTWVRRGDVDAVFPMNYRRTLEAFQAGLDAWTPSPGRARVVPGLSIRGDRSTDEAIALARDQIDAAIAANRAFAVFAYRDLFDSDGGAAKANERRTRLRDALVPRVQAAAE